MLTSAVFYKLDNIIKRWNGTGTMPAAVVDGLEDLGYTNVSKVKKQGLSSGQKILSRITILAREMHGTIS